MSVPESTSANHELINAIAAEMCAGIHRAVGFWLDQIDDVLQDSQLTTLGRLQAVKQVVGSYRHAQATDPMNCHGNAA